MTNALQQVANRKNASDIFEKCWEDYGFKGVREDQSPMTVPVQRVINVDDKETTNQKIKKLDTEKQVGEGLVRKTVGQMQTKGPMDSGQVEDFVPLVFDPEIVSILKQNAPLLDLIPEEGQEGYKAVYNIVGERDRALGFGTEADVLDMTGDTPSDVTFEKQETDMTIWRDRVQISDFTQAAANHYMNVEDTTLGERVAEHAQVKAAQILYGDPSQATTDEDGDDTGFIGSSEGYKGLRTYADEQGNVSDGSTIEEGDRVEAIKAEIHEMIQEENVNVNNLIVGVSHELYDKLENEADFNKLTTDADTRTMNVGLNQLQIAGVPVQTTHNIRAYEDGDDEGAAEYEIGSSGDVFIFSTRTARYRALMPMSMVPLAKTGLSETMALAEFGALIEKSKGNFVRVIEDVSTA